MTTKTQTNEIPAYIDVQAIKAEYAPYNTHPQFEQGYNDYMAGTTRISSPDQVSGQAYDRGMNAALKVRRQAYWIEQNVGAN